MLRFGILSLLLAGCGGRAVVVVDVDAAPGISIAPIDHFEATIGGPRRAGPYRVSPAEAPVALPPSRTFSLSFDADGAGPFVLYLEAFDVDGVAAAHGSASAQAKAAEVTRATIELTLGPAPPMGDGSDGGSDGDGGTAGGLRLAQGGFVTSPGGTAAGSISVHDDGFEIGERACQGSLCVSGGWVP
jgi:hypothetical protein